MSRYFYTFIFVLMNCGVFAQNIIPRFENIGVNDGLSQSSVYSIYQDNKGFMWFGTADGLNRYDGQNIRIYKINDKKIANSNFIHGNICEDSHGNIWFCNETGLYDYDPLADKLNRRLAFNRYAWTEGVFIDKNDVFYIFDPSAGILAYNIGSGVLFKTACQLKRSYYSFAAVMLTTDNKNTIWIEAPDDNALIAFDTQNQKVKYLKTGIKFHSIFYANDGRLYCIDVPGKLIITDTALHVLDTASYMLPKNKMLSVQSLYTDAYHRVWISTSDNGLICYDKVKRNFVHYMHDNSRQKSLPINILSALDIDRSGNLWIGTDGGGVCKLDLKPPKFYLFPLNEGDYPFLKDYFTKCFYEDENHRIWFGTHSSGLNIYDPGTSKVKSYNFRSAQKDGLPGPIITSIFRDREGQMWISTSLGVARFDPKTGKFSAISIINPPQLNEHNNFVYKMIQLQNGDLLAATFWGLMTIRKINGVYTGVFGPNNPDNNILITDVAEMTDHTFWATCPLRGFIHFKTDGQGFRIIEKTLPLIDLRSIHRDEQDKNTLWIGSGIGLIKFNVVTQKQTLYDERNGMANSYIYGILEDGQHNFWTSTNMGICLFNRKDNTFQNYTAKDGLQSNEFNTQSFYKGPSGILYFGGIRGFNWFDPKTIKNTATGMPGVAITAIGVDDVPYIKNQQFAQSKTISLPYDKSNISFQFAALDFTKPQANKVKFILEGWDKRWITADDKSIRYSHLDPGGYTLKVKASNSDGVWSREEKLKIIVNAPFWQQTWFYFCAGVSCLVLIVYLTWFISQQKIKKRLRALERQAAIDGERNRISRDMHDEIGSGLTHIALLSELIQTQQKTDRAIKTDLGNIAASARKLVEGMSEIIWALNPQNDMLESLLSYIREQMQQYFEPFELTLKIDFPDEVPPIKLSNEQRRNLYLVAKEALNNVMKHAGACHVDLSLRLETDHLTFAVNDDGKGMPDKVARPTGNGLKNMRKRMEDIGGEIEWISTGSGTRVTYGIKLPAR